jgi:hypothetical protein
MRVLFPLKLCQAEPFSDSFQENWEFPKILQNGKEIIMEKNKQKEGMKEERNGEDKGEDLTVIINRTANIIKCTHCHS